MECKFYDKLSVEFDLHLINNNATVAVRMFNGIIMKSDFNESIRFLTIDFIEL